MNIMTLNEYSANIEYDPELDQFRGEIIGLNGGADFYGKDPQELKCLKVEDHYILRDGAAGIFLAASQFPRNRETRAPLVSELLSVKEQLDPKFEYLTKAPVQDPDGNNAMYRYSRKIKEQYVMTEVDGKANGWSAHYVDGKWEETLKKKVVKKKVVKKKATKKKAVKATVKKK